MASTSVSKHVTASTHASVVLEEARRAGLLDGEKSEHVSFRAPKALIEAARRESGATKLTELGKAIRDHYAAFMASIPPTRLLTPDADIWMDAGVVAGTLARCQGYQRHQRKECLNDAVIFLTAIKAGLPVLTANRDKFDLIQQLVPQGQFIHF
jgi:hypothetical protein